MPERSLSLFSLILIVRDARSTRASDRSLLFALALRCNPAKQYVCWPTYRVLAEDTGLDEITLRRAAKRLEDAKLIKRVCRDKRSNLFFLNVPLLAQQAEANRAAGKAKQKAKLDLTNPFGDVLLDESPESHDESEEGDTWMSGGAR